VIRKARKRKQGSKDAGCPLAKARLGWTAQLMVRLGNITFKLNDECNKHLTLTNTPHCYDAAKLPELYIYQIAFWDEVHKKQIEGVNVDLTYAFPHDEHGAYDEDGVVTDQETRLHMKYSEQGRFCRDVASVMKDRTEEGRRCHSFDYTERNVVTITVFGKMIKDEIARVKSLPGTSGGWVEWDRRVAGKLWEGDSLKKTTKMGVGNGVRGDILSDYGVRTIGEFRNMSDEMTQLIVGDGRLTSTVWTTIHNNLKDSRVGQAPEKIDHKKPTIHTSPGMGVLGRTTFNPRRPSKRSHALLKWKSIWLMQRER
jgi:hypothetical protein